MQLDTLQTLPQCAQKGGGTLGQRQAQEMASLSQQQCVLRSSTPSMRTDVPRPGGHCPENGPPADKGPFQDAYPYPTNTVSPSFNQNSWNWEEGRMAGKCLTSLFQTFSGPFAPPYPGS